MKQSNWNTWFVISIIILLCVFFLLMLDHNKLAVFILVPAIINMIACTWIGLEPVSDDNV